MEPFHSFLLGSWRNSENAISFCIFILVGETQLFFKFQFDLKNIFWIFFEHNQNYKQSLSKDLLLTRTIYLTEKNLRWLNSNKHSNLMIFHFLFLIRLKKELIAVVRISKQFLYNVQRDLENFFLRFLKFVLFVYEKNQIKIRMKCQ